MISNYQEAFSTQILHTYFDKNICRCLEFIPSPATKALMKRFNCTMRHRMNGFGFYINTTQSLTAALNYIKEITGQTFFEFTLVSNHPHFSCFTEMPVDWSGTIMFDSAGASNVTDENVVMLVAQLINNGSSSPLGKLLVQFSDIINKDVAPVFQISFNARATQWQYFIINRSAVTFDTPAIGKTIFDFTGPQEVVIDNGEKALMFSSADNLIPMSEIPKFKFDLINNPSDKEAGVKSRASKILFRGLPNPDPRCVGIVTVNGQKQLSSPMYIYL